MTPSSRPVKQNITWRNKIKHKLNMQKVKNYNWAFINTDKQQIPNFKCNNICKLCEKLLSNDSDSLSFPDSYTSSHLKVVSRQFRLAF